MFLGKLGDWVSAQDFQSPFQLESFLMVTLFNDLQNFLETFNFSIHPKVYEHCATGPDRKITIHFDINLERRKFQVATMSDVFNEIAVEFGKLVRQNRIYETDMAGKNIEIEKLEEKISELEKEIKELMPHHHYVEVVKEINKSKLED